MGGEGHCLRNLPERGQVQTRPRPTRCSCLNRNLKSRLECGFHSPCMTLNPSFSAWGTGITLSGTNDCRTQAGPQHTLALLPTHIPSACLPLCRLRPLPTPCVTRALCGELFRSLPVSAQYYDSLDVGLVTRMGFEIS